MWNRRQWGLASAGLLLGARADGALAQPVPPRTGVASAPRLVSTRIVIAVENRIALSLLPLTIAEHLGYFREEGLDVEVREFPDAAQAMAAVHSRAAHVLCGGFWQVLLPPARQQAWQSFVVQGRTPQVVLGTSIKSMGNLRLLNNLKGRRIGMRAGDPLCQQVLRRVIEQTGLREEDVVVVPQANNHAAVQSFRNGALDGLCFTDPTITQLEQLGELRVVADTRSLRGTQDLFGGALPSGCISAPGEFIAQYPRVTQALTDAMVHALKWLQTAGLSDIIKTVPEAHFQGDRSLYLAAFQRAREAWTPDGLMPRDGPLTALRMAARQGETLNLPPAELANSFTNDFAVRAKARFRA